MRWYGCVDKPHGRAPALMSRCDVRRVTDVVRRQVQYCLEKDLSCHNLYRNVGIMGMLGPTLVFRGMRAASVFHVHVRAALLCCVTAVQVRPTEEAITLFFVFLRHQAHGQRQVQLRRRQEVDTEVSRGMLCLLRLCIPGTRYTVHTRYMHPNVHMCRVRVRVYMYIH